MMKVLCFGNLQFDILCRSVVALPPPGKLRLIDSIDFALSGNGGSVAASLGRLGIEVDLAGYTGADVIGEQFRSQLEEMGIGASKLLRHPDAGTGTSVITLAPDGERSIMLVNGANALFDLDTVPDEWFENIGLVAVLSVFLLPQFTGESVGRLFHRAKAHGAHTLLNICWDTQNKGLESLKPALAETDYFMLNADEGKQLTNLDTPEDIVACLQASIPGSIVMTLGSDGSCLLDHNRLEYIPVLPVEAVDSTGAGDGFIAGFCAGLVTGHTLSESAYLGSAAASFSVTGPGAYLRMPALAELKHLISHTWDATT